MTTLFAVRLDGTPVPARLVLARAVWTTSRRDDARGQALAARTLADSDQERAQVQSVLDFFDRQSR